MGSAGTASFLNVDESHSRRELLHFADDGRLVQAARRSVVVEGGGCVRGVNAEAACIICLLDQWGHQERCSQDRPAGWELGLASPLFLVLQCTMQHLRITL
uniref:Uncharacterized protein n=1 Tax=Chrysotila carterae TaxID=13221 RepID=A0A7S4F0Z2_CHRCT